MKKLTIFVEQTEKEMQNKALIKKEFAILKLSSSFPRQVYMLIAIVEMNLLCKKASIQVSFFKVDFLRYINNIMKDKNIFVKFIFGEKVIIRQKFQFQ